MIEYISAISHKIVRSSRPKVFCEKGVKKVKKTLAQVFSYEFCEISKNTFSHRTPLVASSDLFKLKELT